MEKEAKESFTSIEISRGMHQECITNLESVENYFVYDEDGNKIRFGDLYIKRKTIIVFVRHFLCYVCKEYVEDLAKVPQDYLQEADVQLVVIGPAAFKFIKDFRELTNLPYPIYTDPEQKIYEGIGCSSKMKLKPYSHSIHVKSSPFTGILKSTWRAMKSAREFQGPIKQLGASLIAGPGNVLHFSHIDQTTTDHAPINDLLSMAGVKQVNFDKGARVQDI